MGSGAEDHEEAGHENGDTVQVYLPFGSWSFANLPINKAESSWSMAGKQEKEQKKEAVVFLAFGADLIGDCWDYGVTRRDVLPADAFRNDRSESGTPTSF